MKIITALLFCLGIIGICNAQEIPTKEEITNHFGFTEHTTNSDIHFYKYHKGAKPSKLIIYLQGSDPSPLFSYQIKNNKTSYNCFLRPDFKALSKEYLYVAIEKTGFEGVTDENNIKVPEIYIQTNSLDHRVNQVDMVINELSKTNKFSKIIVYGHSEGAPVVAKLGTVNDKITHLGFWAGNALPDYYDFILESRIAFYKGEITDVKSQENIDKTIDSFVNRIAKDTANTEGGGYTALRWWSYAEPSINNLLKIDVPIYVQVGTLDQSAPIESTYLIPLEFARKGKTNLSYNVCTGCDHGFYVTTMDGKRENKWSQIFEDFINWTENTR